MAIKVNPPFAIPAVEVVPGPFTYPDIVKVRALLFPIPLYYVVPSKLRGSVPFSGRAVSPAAHSGYA